MSQQINLFQPILRRERVLFSAMAMVQSVAVVAVVLVAFTVYIQWRVAAQGDELAALSAQRDQLTQQLADASRRLPPGQEDPALAAKVSERQRELQAKRAFLREFSGREMGNTEGFSPIMAGLARQRSPDLWLEGFHLTGAGGVTLQGQVLEAAALPAWLQQLSNEPVFVGLEFQTLLMERDEEDSRSLRFELRTQREATQP